MYSEDTASSETAKCTNIMANVRNYAHVALKEGEKVFNIGELLRDKEQNPDTQSLYDELFAIGEGKGIPFEFKVGELVTFDEYTKSGLIMRISKLNGKEYRLLSVLADSNLRGEIEVPLSIFRRIPALEVERKELESGFPLTEWMMDNHRSDLARLIKLAGKTINVVNDLFLARIAWKTINGVAQRVDVAAQAPEERKRMHFYQIQIAQ